VTPEDFISRFPGARKTGNGKWSAKCPAHEDRDPSLSLGVLPDGRILIHCHAGCEPLAVLGAVGLDLSDLFPDKGLADYMRGWFNRRAREARINEERIVAIARADLAAGKRLSLADQKRLDLAISRLRNVDAEPSDSRSPVEI